MRTGFLLFLLMTATAFGWEAELSLDPQITRIGQRTTLSLTLSGLRNPSQPDQISLKGLRTGPFSSRSSSVQIINGEYSQKVTYSCALLAEHAGDFVIPLNYTQQGETKKLQTTLTVLAAGEDQEATQLDEMFSAKLKANTDHIYVHEPFELQLDIYTLRGAQITDRINLSNMPESGLEELKWTEIQTQQRVENNRIYTVRRFRCQTQALTAGAFNFSPQVTVQAIESRNRRNRDPFFNSFFDRAQTEPVQLNVKPFTLNVQPLPFENKPANFSEGVGALDFTVDNIPAEITQGDPITVRMRVSGTGNLKNVKVPVFASKNGIKTYDSSRTSITETEAVFEQILMLNDPSMKQLPALTFSWFNPKTEKYQSITRGPFPITIKPNGSAIAQVITETATPIAQTEILGEDILYLKPLPKRWHSLNEPFWYQRTRFLCLLPLPALLAAGVCLIIRYRRKLHADPAELRKRGAIKIVQPCMKATEHAAHTNETALFYSELWNALTVYFSNKLNLSAGEISETNLTDTLREIGVAPSLLESFTRVMRLCEQSRFGMAPSTSSDELLAQTKTVKESIKYCERKLK